ncbi:MAG TPA: FAD-dependent monooxygenase [Xanthomonadaceae bacterium]|nr:FAD-dependent monooxygenase [Xanthomonadaceae bacterium]
MHASAPSYPVIIAGAGPTGLTLAAELALAGVAAIVVEPRPDQQLAGSRAGGLHARTIELLDQRGVADRFLAAGQIARTLSFAGAHLDITDFPSRHPYVLGLWQNHIERLLAEWVRELGVTVRHGCAVTGFRQDDAGVDVTLSDGNTLRAGYLVGCDGGRSLVRKAAGIEFAGWDATTSALIAEVEMADAPPLGVRHDATGMHGIGRVEYEVRDGEVVFADSGTVRVMLTEAAPGATDAPTLEDLAARLREVYGTDFGVHGPSWISRFTDASRQATAYRAGRVLLAGDAAHIHAPDGGQGLNIGMQDAVNLGWKLAQVVTGVSPDTLLDSYHAERHPVGARVLRTSMASVALRRPDARNQAARDIVSELLAFDAPRKHLAGELSGLGLRYDLGDAHPLLGRRMPDLDLDTRDGPLRTYALLHAARPLLLNFVAPGALAVDGWADRVHVVDATCSDGAWELPVIGRVPAPAAVLVRPDGHVAWVGDGSDRGLPGALATWCGPPRD